MEESVPDPPRTVTRLLQAWKSGRQDALDEMLPLVYGELRRLAARYMQGERAGHTLQATALVHEAYARLVDVEIDATSRAQFFALASRAMRNVLVDHARARGRSKRGGGLARVTLDEALVVSGEPDPALIDLDVALTELAAQDERKSCDKKPVECPHHVTSKKTREIEIKAQAILSTALKQRT